MAKENPNVDPNRNNALRSGERQVHARLEGIEEWHKWRYLEAMKYTAGKKVLDVGCGCGYGSAMIAENAQKVHAIDVSVEAVEYATEHWFREHMVYYRASFLDMPPIPVDVIVAFEVLEHLPDTGKAFEKLRAFDAERIIISVPHLITPFGGNKFHYRHYGMDEMVEWFQAIGYKIERGELLYFGHNLNVFVVAKRR